MAANLSLVMDDTDKVRALRDDALSLGLEILAPDVNASNYRFEPVDDEADTLRARRHQRDRPSRRSRPSSPHARAAGHFATYSISAAAIDKRHRQPARRRGADPRRRVRRDRSRGARRSSPPSASRWARPSAPKPRRRRCRCSARNSTTAGLTLVATREWTEAERLVHEKAALGYLPFGTSVRGLRAGAGTPRQDALANLQPRTRAGADRRHRHGAARAVESPRQDGVRHAGRWAALSRDRRVQRNLRRRAAASCARTSSSSSRQRSSRGWPTTGRCRVCASSPKASTT